MLDLTDLVSVSHRLGENLGYVQGGGGNTSLKDGAGVMFIKSSGINLAEATAQSGFVPVHHDMIKSGIGTCRTEEDYSRLLSECIADDVAGRRPSIETGFHAILGRCVLHSHSVWVNQLTCAAEGQEALARLFPEALWVPYFTPGLRLTLEILERMGDTPPQIIFLQNHGLIVSGELPADTLELHESVNLRLREELGDHSSSIAMDSRTLEVEPDRVLFPDQAVYLFNPSLASSIAGHQTLWAYSFLMGAMARLGLTPRFLGHKEIDILVNLDSEKYRQRIAQS